MREGGARGQMKTLLYCIVCIQMPLLLICLNTVENRTARWAGITPRSIFPLPIGTDFFFFFVDKTHGKPNDP